MKYALESEKVEKEDFYRQICAQIEKLDYTKLYSAYSRRIPKSQVEQRILFEILVCAYAHNVYSTRKIETPKGCRHHKLSILRQRNEVSVLLQRWETYEIRKSILGEGQNSYSKMDPDATFIRMKEDHMGNGQLKPG